MREPESGRSWTSKVFNTVITLDTYQFCVYLIFFLTEFQKITISASKWASIRNLVLETDFTKISYIFEAKCRGVSNLSSHLLLMNLCFRCPLDSLYRLPPLKADLFQESRISLM